jgi:hypothetical protein
MKSENLHEFLISLSLLLICVSGMVCLMIFDKPVTKSGMPCIDNNGNVIDGLTCTGKVNADIYTMIAAVVCCLGILAFFFSTMITYVNLIEYNKKVRKK